MNDHNEDVRYEGEFRAWWTPAALLAVVVLVFLLIAH